MFHGKFVVRCRRSNVPTYQGRSAVRFQERSVRWSPKLAVKTFPVRTARPSREKNALTTRKRSVEQFLRRNVSLFQQTIVLESVVRCVKQFQDVSPYRGKP